MKKFTKVLAALSLMAVMVSAISCKKDTDPNISEFKIVREYLDVKTTTATITGSFDYPGKISGIKVAVGRRHDFTDAHSFLADMDGTNFTAEVTGLQAGTEYHYHYEVDYGFTKPFITETKTFITNSEAPTVKTLEVLALDSTTFRVKCEVVADGGSKVTERGICWNTYGDPTLDDETKQYNTGGLGQYTLRLEHLALGKKYYVRAYAKNVADMIGYSEEVLEFETNAPAGLPVEIELSCNPEEGGTVTGGGSYEVGTQCTVTAEANMGYTFVNWTENGSQVSSQATYTFPVTVGRSLVANFTKQAYVITAEVTPENSGTVTGAGGFNYGEECTLTATPKNGYDFVKWTKGGSTVSTDAEYTFTVNATATYVAHFQIKHYSVSVSANPQGSGTVSGGGTFSHGDECTLHASPAAGYAFTKWTDDGDEISTEPDYTFTVTSNRTLVAHFAALQPNEYTIQISANPSSGGTVTGGGTYQQGQSCKVTATSKPGFTFVNWTENGTQVSDLAEYQFNVTGSRVLVANFEAQAPSEYTVSVSANPSTGGTVTGGGTYQQGGQCTVTATANEGYTFVNWTENGNEVSTNASITFIVNSDRTLVANFTIKSYTISVSANPSNGGTVSGGGNYNHGQSCTVIATAASGYSFTNWTENGNVVSNNANYTFNVTSNHTLVANFTAQSQPPTGAINGLFSVSATQQVWFSQGNLQYIGTANTPYWKFADNQWDYFGTSGNGNDFPNSNRDLFAWGTSGFDHGAVCYQPWSSSLQDEYYYAYGDPSYNLFNQSGQADWGYNRIDNGGDELNIWRTLTDQEWNYVLNTRTTLSGYRYALACVNEINGLILLPDNWDSSLYNIISNNSLYQSNTIDANDWMNILELNGAIFLPAAGYYSNSFGGIGTIGRYWSSSVYDSSSSIFVGFEHSGYSAYESRCIRRSVRLVQDYQP